MADEVMDMEFDVGGDSLANRYLIFDIKDEFYAIEITYITEIVEMLPVTAVPHLPECIVGIINLRGSIIPIMDVRMRFGYETKEYDSRTCIIVMEHDDISVGMVVDSVQEVAKIHRDSIAKPPTNGTNAADYYIKGIARWKNEIQLIIDPDKMYEMDEQVLNAANG